VIDSSDKERMDKVKEELFFVLEEEELKNSPFVIMANKQVRINIIIGCKWLFIRRSSTCYLNV
jgi:hypothetical protein